VPEDDAVADREVDAAVIIGIMAASESSAMIALSPRIERRFSIVGRWWGGGEKRTMRTSVRIKRP
jgi:hypothetical protein